MSTAAVPLDSSRPRGRANFEQALYTLSPLGLWGTTLAILFVLLATFGAALAIDRYPPVVHAAQGWALQPGVWPAFVLSLLLTVALGMQRYVRLKDHDDDAVLETIMPGCREFEARMLDARGRRGLRIATVLGAILGAGATWVFVPRSAIAAHPAMYLWFGLVQATVTALFWRGIVASARGAESWALAIDKGLIVDLLRIDSLNIIGRQGARNALIWFSVAAVIFLFFIGNNMGGMTLAILALAAAMGLWIFIRPMERVHQRIRAAKQAELETVRREIGASRAEAPREASAAAKLQGLLAYEARIEAVREWPFDQPTAIRVAAFVLIPAIPWFGQAIAGYFIANLVHLPI
ncbi:MAG TPA: hypothetical protein VIM02_08470 [Rhizomicrobium sp.]|jgi:hypothetical protein